MQPTRYSDCAVRELVFLGVLEGTPSPTHPLTHLRC